MTDDATLTLARRIARELAARGIEIAIGGCGCCASPDFRLRIDGEWLTSEHGESRFTLDMMAGTFDEHPLSPTTPPSPALRFRVVHRLSNGIEVQMGSYDTVDEAKACILRDVGRGRRSDVAADHIDNDGLFYAGWDYGIFPEEIYSRDAP